jgi:ATP-dependent RNA helicase A
LFEASEKKHGMTVSWCPPMQNWNPWIGCNIDEGPMATVTKISNFNKSL